MNNEEKPITDEQIDALDTFALHAMAPLGRESVRKFARAVIAAIAEPAQGAGMSNETDKPIEKYAALAEKCGAEVGRHEGEMVWMKFHSQSSVEAFAAGLVMLAALNQPATQTEAEDWQIWCDTCEGSGKVYQEHQHGCHVGGKYDCPDCGGNGYFVKRLAANQKGAA